MYRLLWYECEYQHGIKNRTRCYFYDQSLRECNVSLSINMMNKNCIMFPDRVVSTVLLLLCEKSCPPQQQEQGLPAAVPGLGTTDVKLHCCCWWCCSPVLLLLWFGHTHAQNCVSDLWVEGIHTTSRGTRAASRPRHLPSHSDRAQTLRNTTSYILLQRGFTATLARCWAALYGVGCLSVRAAKAVPLCVSRAPPLGMFVLCLKRRDHSGRYGNRQ